MKPYPHSFHSNLLRLIDLFQVPGTSHLVACEFVAEDHTAQLCLRIIQWLEGLASKALDLEAKVVYYMFFAWNDGKLTCSQ